MEIALDVGVSTDIGKREKNEDAYYNCLQRQDKQRIPAERLEERGYLFAVADGRGGTTGGAEASQIAVETLDDFYLMDEASPLEEIIQQANWRIYRRNQERQTQMATTLTVAHLRKGRLSLAHCGDSRAYYLNCQGLQQISRDHNQATDEIENGTLRQEEMAHIPFQKRIQLFAPYRMLGDASFIEVDTIWWGNEAPNKCHNLNTRSHPLNRGDYILLTTDGLIEKFDKDERKVAQYLRDTIVLKQSAQQIATHLVSIARCKGTCDNTTVLVIQVK